MVGNSTSANYLGNPLGPPKNMYCPYSLTPLIRSMSIPLKGSLADHDKYILGLRKLLDEPTFLTNANTAPLFQQFANTGIRIFRVSQLQGLAREPERIYSFPGGHQVQDEVAMIMLTSGSTGVSKAVAIKHRQILHSLGGKQEML